MKLHVDKETGEVTFYIVRNIADEWDFESYDAYFLDAPERDENPVKTVRTMPKMLEDYIKRHKPKYLVFSGNSEKKQRIYEHLIRKFSPSGYSVAIDDGKVWLYRILAL